jgi:hypothetical protein
MPQEATRHPFFLAPLRLCVSSSSSFNPPAAPTSSFCTFGARPYATKTTGTNSSFGGPPAQQNCEHGGVNHRAKCPGLPRFRIRGQEPCSSSPSATSVISIERRAELASVQPSPPHCRPSLREGASGIRPALVGIRRRTWRGGGLRAANPAHASQRKPCFSWPEKRAQIIVNNTRILSWQFW